MKAIYKSRRHKEEENVSYFALRKELLLLLYSLFVYKHQFACRLHSVYLFFLHAVTGILKWEAFGVEWQKQSLQVHLRQRLGSRVMVTMWHIKSRMDSF